MSLSVGGGGSFRGPEWDASTGERTPDEPEDGCPFTLQTFPECPLWACPVLADRGNPGGPQPCASDSDSSGR